MIPKINSENSKDPKVMILWVYKTSFWSFGPAPQKVPPKKNSNFVLHKRVVYSLYTHFEKSQYSKALPKNMPLLETSQLVLPNSVNL